MWRDRRVAAKNVRRMVDSKIVGDAYNKGRFGEGKLTPITGNVNTIKAYAADQGLSPKKVNRLISKTSAKSAKKVGGAYMQGLRASATAQANQAARKNDHSLF